MTVRSEVLLDAGFALGERPMSIPGSPAPELAIRVGGIDELFVSLDARPVAERALREKVRLKLLDEWEHIRDGRSPTPCVQMPAPEQPGTGVDAVGAAVRADLSAHTRWLHYVNPLGIVSESQSGPEF